MDQIHLEKLTWDTVEGVLKLRVSKEQKEFVARNSDSLIDAYFFLTEEKKNVFTFGIYNGKKPVGFLMIGYNCVWRENLDFAKKNLTLTIHSQAILEGVATTFAETEAIIEGARIQGMTEQDIRKIVNMKHAWEFIAGE